MASSSNGATANKTYFEQQRELLVNDVATVREHALSKL